MATLPRTLAACAAVLCATLALVMPAAAINTAIYGSAAGFVPALHQDTFSVTCTLPGTAGIELDNNISCFTNASTDVIFIGGDAGYTQATATALANATNAGKILIVTGTDLPRFTDVLPAQTTGIAPSSLALLETDPNTTISEDIFAGMPSRFPNTTPVSNREQYVTRAGATTLLNFENGDPALVFAPYGNGYVVAWLPPADQAYLTSTDADLINERLVTHLLALRNGEPEVTATASANTTAPTPSAPDVAPTTATSVPAFGNVSVYSSPLGATVFIDGVYEGNTPVNLTGISPGSHALILATNGYYDYDTTISVVGAENVTAFG